MTIPLTLPNQSRAWWVEARGVNGVICQAPPARRIAVASACYAAFDTSKRGDDALLRFDPTTGATVLRGATGTCDIEAIALQPGTGALLASNAKQLGTLDLDTGRFAAIGAFGTGNGSEGRVGFKNVDGQAFDPRTGVLFGIHRRVGARDILFQIDPGSGQLVANAFGPGIDYRVITGPKPTENIDDIAIDATGTLYATADALTSRLPFSWTQLKGRSWLRW